MNLKEYKKWLEEHANKEERQAYAVVERIVEYHQNRAYANLMKDIDVFPRKKLNGLEFDLLIYLHIKSKRPEHRTREDILIGVEFKESDLNKVIKQAIARREFVDYMYIATNCRAWDVEQIFLLALYGIGWVFWDNQFVKIILEPRRYANRVDTLIDYLFDDKLREIIDEQIDEKIQRRLDDWIGCQKKGID